MSEYSETEESENYKLPSQDLVNLIQGQLHSLIGKKSTYIKSLPNEVQTRINGLKSIQLRHSKLEKKFNQDVFELEKRYLELYKPLFEERFKIINGINEPSAEDVEIGRLLRDEEEAEDEEETEDEEEVTDEHSNISNAPTDGIPEFWLTILKNHPGICELINEDDEKALRYLVDINYRFLEDELGYALDFTFDKNEFFSNTVITKKYYYTQSPDFGEFLLDRAEGTEIDWYEGQDLTKEIQQKKQVHKVTHETRVITEVSPRDSFFAFFSPVTLLGELSEKEERAFQNAVEADYELGEEFKLKIIPHAIDWFTGKALAFEAPLDDYDEDSEDED